MEEKGKRIHNTKIQKLKQGAGIRFVRRAVCAVHAE